MPLLSLIVCLHQERDLLERLLAKADNCYDDLVVVHDGTDTQGVRAIVESAGGRFFERPRAFQQEPHLPFAFQQAEHNWILRLDADEFPSEDLKKWLQEFRRSPEPSMQISGYTVIWPLWNGKKVVSQKIWDGRLILFNRQRIKFFGMVEQGPIPEGKTERTGLVLFHQPHRKSYGLYNILVRRQAYHWRKVIAQSLLGKPTDLPCWRWTDPNWPLQWEQIRRHPFHTAARRLVMETFRGLRAQWRAEKRFYFEAALSSPIHHAMLCLKFWQLHRSHYSRNRHVQRQAE